MAENLTIPPNVTRYLEIGKFGEDGKLADSEGIKIEFLEFVAANWEAIFASIDKVAPRTSKKILILTACEYLGPGDYLRVLEKLVQQSNTPGFDLKIWNAVLAPTDAKSGFLAYNYQNVRVIAVINRILATLPVDHPFRAEIPGILSGEAKADFLRTDSDYTNGNFTHIALPQ